ncbi:MAG: MoaD/ThiS family protein [Acidobacteria bacterium]|nr:MoaD/ThiS family protein [Acidobacteriota bacterium]
MARLRLFANLREIADTTEVDVPGSTVGEVLNRATEMFGDDFGRALAAAQVWVDGTQATTETTVQDGAEIALIPPVSGGALAVWSSILAEIGLTGFLTAVLFLANSLSLQWLSVATVLVGGLWAFDVVGSGERRGLSVGTAPGLLGVLGGVLATYRFGAPGMAAATVGVTLLVLIWGVINPNFRSIESIASGISIGTTVTFGSASLVLLRLRSEEEAAAFLFVAASAIAVSWLSDRSDMPVLDPLVAMIVASITAGAIAGAVWAPDLLTTVAASVAGALALVAGRNMGMLVRVGGFFVAGPVPGNLHNLDGLFMASGPFWLLLTVLG